ncbi:MAG TPA: alpha/beta fold hydrolase, partial [Acidimicrobiales bacterium]|nr:alpha/beta fold hydrolase [Acidimicrobiales bacterium]
MGARWGRISAGLVNFIRTATHGLRDPSGAHDNILEPLSVVVAVVLAASSLSILLVGPGLGQNRRPLADGRSLTVAREVVDDLLASRYQEATRRFDATMAAGLPADQLQAVWEDTRAKLGGFVGRGPMHEGTTPRGLLICTRLQFERSTIWAEVGVNRDRRISSLYLRGADRCGREAITAPSYVDPDRFVERSVIIGAAPYLVPGTLTVPKGRGPFAAVVMVHGSGPADRDGTVGKSTPYRDLAWGLASQGIAVLRYDKRTLVYARALSTQAITPHEETVEDAAAAVALLRTTAGIDRSRVFVVAHSLGAYLAPRIAAAAPDAAGFVLLAPPADAIEDTIIRQSTYLAGLTGGISKQEAAAIERLRVQADRVKDPSLSASTATFELPLSVPASYWLALRGYDPPT